MRLWLGALLAVRACTTAPTQAASADNASNTDGTIAGDPKDAPTPAKTTTTATPPDLMPAIVYVRMHEYDNDLDWFCTGTLIAKDRVVTAGHCLDVDTMYGWQVIAPNAPGAPRVDAVTPTSDSRMGSNEETGDADFGVLTLETPIEIATYATIMDASTDVASGKITSGKAVVRTAEEPEAPFHTVDVTGIESATDEDYVHGYRSKGFSHGGDSGAGIFLVEDGVLTMKLFAVERDPDGSSTDYQTRIDPDVVSWLSSH